MKTINDFLHCSNRYSFDFGCCSVKNNYAQCDTGQDASYFGIWANPFELKIVTYAEGDVIIKLAENDKEFIGELRAIQDWHNDEGNGGFVGVDAGFNEGLKGKFLSLGLGDLLH